MSRLYIDNTDGITAIRSSVNGYAENLHSNGTWKDFSKIDLTVVAQNLGVLRYELSRFLKDSEYASELLSEEGGEE